MDGDLGMTDYGTPKADFLEEVVKLLERLHVENFLGQRSILIEEREIAKSAWTSEYAPSFKSFTQARPDSQRMMRYGAADVSVPQGKT